MENAINEIIKSFSPEEAQAFSNANFQDWYLLDIYKKCPKPKALNFKKRVLEDLKALRMI